METPKILWPAIRQYKHNDGSDGFVGAFDRDETIKLVRSLEATIKRRETESLVMVTLLSGIAAGNNSRKDAAEYIRAMLKRLEDASLKMGEVLE